MPHKDRERRLAYLRTWKKRKRPSPTPEHQPDRSLPPRGRMVFSMDGSRVQCHCCGRWFGSLNTHLKSHDFDAASYKEQYDLPRTASLWPPALRQKQHRAALDRDQGSIGCAYLPPSIGRPTGQQARLGARIAASEARKDVYMRGGEKTNPS